MADADSAGIAHSSSPELRHRSTQATLVDTSKESEARPSDRSNGTEGNFETEKHDSGKALDEELLPVAKPRGESCGQDKIENQSPELHTSLPYILKRRLKDIAVLICIGTMLLGPWIFWVIVRSIGGIPIGDDLLGHAIRAHPQGRAFFVSLIGNTVAFIDSMLFSFSIVRFSQEWIADRGSASVFQVMLLNAFRSQSFPWTLGDIKALVRKNRWMAIIFLSLCIIAFQFVASGVNSLLLPIGFYRTEALVGEELDFASGAPECLEWLNANRERWENCDWQEHHGAQYATCLGQNQISDFLAASRSNMVSLIPNSSEFFAFEHLGGASVLRIVGSLEGILPIGPNGPVPGQDTILLNETSIFKRSRLPPSLIAYNYTLGYQGLSSDFNCTFDDKSPVVFSPAHNGPTGSVAWVNGTCPEGMDIMSKRGVSGYPIHNEVTSLGYWPCKAYSTESGGPSYLVYIRDRGQENYANPIGNITCNVSTIQPAIYPVTYQSQAGLFKFESHIPSFLPDGDTHWLTEQLLVTLARVVADLQNSNILVESVITFGAKAFRLPPRGRMTEKHLPIWSVMLEGILDYEASYTRLLYSNVDDRPPSCTRQIEGNVTYFVLGWDAEPIHIIFLMPMTLLNMMSFIVILAAIIMTKSTPSVLSSNPADTRSFLYVQHQEGNDNSSVMSRTINFNRIADRNLANDGLMASQTATIALNDSNTVPLNID